MNGIIIDDVFYEFVDKEADCSNCGLLELCQSGYHNLLCALFYEKINNGMLNGMFIKRGKGGYYVPKMTDVPQDEIADLRKLIQENKSINEKLKSMSEKQENLFNTWKIMLHKLNTND